MVEQGVNDPPYGLDFFTDRAGSVAGDRGGTKSKRKMPSFEWYLICPSTGHSFGVLCHFIFGKICVAPFPWKYLPAHTEFWTSEHWFGKSESQGFRQYMIVHIATHSLYAKKNQDDKSAVSCFFGSGKLSYASNNSVSKSEERSCSGCSCRFKFWNTFKKEEIIF